ncbi:MAG TPA: hypothetical protein VH619_11675 [Verrucomicrobiae bacterium]|nr:hypothetical protein [Verrucomicrobiae bacterium]
MALFPKDRIGAVDDADIVRIRLSQLSLHVYTQPETDVQLLLQQLKLELPAQPPPKVTASKPPGNVGSVVKT